MRNMLFTPPQEETIVDVACPVGSTVVTGGDIQSAINSASTGGTVCIPAGSYTSGSTITINKALTVVGISNPTITQTFSSGNLINITASNVILKGVHLVGANRNTNNNSCGYGCTAINIGAYSGDQIIDCIVDSFGCGIVASGSSNFTLRSNRVLDVSYGSIVGSGANNGTVDRCTVTNVCHDGTLDDNAYGITMTMSGSTRCHDVTMTKCYVMNAPTWECYDTHNGQRIYWYDCVGITFGRVGFNQAWTGLTPESTYQIDDCRVENCYLDDTGISMDWGNSVVNTGTGTVKDNVIRNVPSNIYAPNCTVSGNSITTGDADIMPPSIPTGVRLVSHSQSTITLAWNASVDNVEVAEYDVYRDSSYVATTSSTTYTDTGRASSTSYSYEILARDTSSNESVAKSYPVSLSTT